MWKLSRMFRKANATPPRDLVQPSGLVDESKLPELKSLLTAALEAAITEDPTDPVAFTIQYLQNKQMGNVVAQRAQAAALIQSRWRGKRARVDLGKVVPHAGTQVNALITMDPGQDLDDEMLLVLLAAMIDRGLVKCSGIVTCLAPAGMRAQLARGTLDMLGLPRVPVCAGSDGGGSGDSSMMAEIEYLTRLKPAEDTGIELMQSVLREAPDRSVTVVVVSSLKDVAMWLQAEEALFVAKVATVVIQGGVEPFTTGVAGPDGYLVPDTAHNNQFDRQAAEFFYRRCQQVGIPLLVVSRFAAYAAPVPRTVYDELAATGSPIGKHLQSAQRRSIEQLWRRACAPDESEVRAGLPARCNKEWFCDTFCNGEGKGRDGGQSIWDVIVSFNMYDPLALVAALPTLSHLFEYDELVVGGVTHRVVGSSAQHTGIKDGAELRAWLGRNFRLGMSPETHTAVGGAIESRNSMGRPTATLPLTA